MKSYHLFKELVIYYLVQQLIEHISANNIKTHEQLIESLPSKSVIAQWMNVGGQLILRSEVDKLNKQIVAGKVKRLEWRTRLFMRNKARITPWKSWRMPWLQ